MKHLVLISLVICAPVLAMYSIDGKVVEKANIERVCAEGGGCIWLTRAKLVELLSNCKVRPL